MRRFYHPASLCLALAAIVLAGCEQNRPDPAPGAATVRRVGDGDTLELESGRRVRLLQIDAPELGEGECYAREAQRELQGLTPPGTRIELERDSRLDDTDRYDRLLRYVLVEGANVNVELVRRGAAAPYFRHGREGRLAGELLDAVADARSARRGMWGACRVSWQRDRQVVTRSG